MTISPTPRRDMHLPTYLKPPKTNKISAPSEPGGPVGRYPMKNNPFLRKGRSYRTLPSSKLLHHAVTPLDCLYHRHYYLLRAKQTGVGPVMVYQTRISMPPNNHLPNTLELNHLDAHNMDVSYRQSPIAVRLSDHLPYDMILNRLYGFPKQLPQSIGI